MDIDINTNRKDYFIEPDGFFQNVDKEDALNMIDNKFYKTKVEYVDSLDDIAINTASNYIRNFIAYILPMEESFRKDLYEFNLDEIRLTMKSAKTTSQSLKTSLFYLIKNYINWAYIQGYRATANDILLLESDKSLVTTEKSRLEKNYISADRLFAICERAITSKKQVKKQRVVDYTTCTAVLLMRLGFRIEEVVELNIDMVDRDNLEINYNNEYRNYKKTIKINEEMLEYIDNSIMGTGNKLLVRGRDEFVLRKDIKDIFVVARTRNYTPLNLLNSKMIDELDQIKMDNGKVMVEDVQRVKKFYEPTIGVSSYVTLKNLYSKLRGVTIEKDKPGVKSKKDIVAELLANLD